MTLDASRVAIVAILLAFAVPPVFIYFGGLAPLAALPATNSVLTCLVLISQYLREFNTLAACLISEASLCLLGFLLYGTLWAGSKARSHLSWRTELSLVSVLGISVGLVASGALQLLTTIPSSGWIMGSVAYFAVIAASVSAPAAVAMTALAIFSVGAVANALLHIADAGYRYIPKLWRKEMVLDDLVKSPPPSPRRAESQTSPPPVQRVLSRSASHRRNSFLNKSGRGALLKSKSEEPENTVIPDMVHKV